MKKLFLIIAIILLLIISALFTAPFLFKKQLLETAQKEINKSVNAHVVFDDFRLSLIKHFPDLSVSLTKLTVTGMGDFEGDTLVSFRSFTVTLDLLALLKNQVTVKSFYLDKPIIYARILENGKANYDITPPSEEISDTTIENPADTSQMLIQLKKFVISNGKVVYDDIPSGVYTLLDNLNLTLSGNFIGSFTSLNLSVNAARLDFAYEGVKYINKVTFSLFADMDADLDKWIFTLKENEVKLNELALIMKGTVEMPGDDIKTDLVFNAKQTDFKTLLSLVPAIYSSDFEGIQTSGSLLMKGSVKGTVTDSTIPDVEMKLVVNNATFNYPDLPEKVENININLILFNDGVSDVNSYADIQKFHMDIAGNPFDIRMVIKAYAIDPLINGTIKMNVNLSRLKNAIPLGDMELTGNIAGDITLSGALSALENEKYQDFKASGALTINEMVFNSSDLPAKLNILSAILSFTPQYLNLSSFDARIGNSDLKLNGKIENYLLYLFSDGTLKANLNLQSGFLDINELLESDTTSSEKLAEIPVSTDTTAEAAFEIPKNLDIVFNAGIKKMQYDRLKINDFIGIIKINSGKAYLEKLNMKALKGSLNMAGFYDPTDLLKPKTNLSLDFTDIDIPAAYETFNTVKKLAPVSKNSERRISMKLDFSAILDKDMSPLLNTVDGRGRFQSKTIGVKNSETVNKMAEVLKNDNYRNLTLNDIKALFTIKNGRINFEPFKTSLAGQQAEISGSQGIDQSMDYLIKLQIPKSQFTGGAADVLNVLTSNAVAQGLSLSTSDFINVNVNIGGFFKEPKISFGLGEFTSAGAMKDQIVNKAKEQVNKQATAIKEKAKEQTKAQADKLIKDAENEAERLKAEAKKLADQVRKEGDIAAQKILDEAKNKNVFAKKAAQVLADKTRKEAEDKAKLIEDEAAQKADNLIKEARVKATKL